MKRSKSDTSVVDFHIIGTLSLSAGVNTLQVSPSGFNSLSTRFGNMADGWGHFRVRRLRFRLLPSLAATANIVVMGYVGGIEDTTPATVATVGELMASTSMQAGACQTVPSNWVNVPRVELAGPFPWYKAINGAATTTEEAPGLICFAGTGTQTFYFEFYVTFEFKVALDPGNTPMAISLRKELLELRRKAAIAKEKEALERVLGGQVVVLPQQKKD